MWLNLLIYPNKITNSTNAFKVYMLGKTKFGEKFRKSQVKDEKITKVGLSSCKTRL